MWLWNFFTGRPVTERVLDKPLHESCKIKCTETLSDNTVKHRCCEECETSFHRCCEKTVPDLRLQVGGKLCWLVNLEGVFKVPVRFTVVYGNMRGYAKCPMWDLYKENLKYLSLIFSFRWFPNFPKRLFDIRLNFALFICQTLFCLSSCLSLENLRSLWGILSLLHWEAAPGVT